MDKNSFRTEIEITEFPEKIGYQSSCMFIGSCFTHHIGERMRDLKFKVDLNPFGMIYNPLSVLNSLKILQEGKFFTKQDLHYHEKKWFSFSHYTGFSNADQEVCLKKINDRIKTSSGFFQNGDFLFITLGTAWVYQWKETNEVVSNCHKLPASKFNRRLLDVGEITKTYTDFFTDLLSRQPDMKVILTLSPVRHWKDGAVENQRSKSILLLAVHNMVEQFQNCFYFPAYEIMMDDLRDYRFYAEDMLHISPSGANYIWEKFRKAFIDSGSLSLMSEVEKISRAVNHRPLNPASEEYRKFVAKTLSEIQQLVSKYPFLNFSEEEKSLNKRVRNGS